jgi:hypothetical protein
MAVPHSSMAASGFLAGPWMWLVMTDLRPLSGKHCLQPACWPCETSFEQSALAGPALEAAGNQKVRRQRTVTLITALPCSGANHWRNPSQLVRHPQLQAKVSCSCPSHIGQPLNYVMLAGQAVRKVNLHTSCIPMRQRPSDNFSRCCQETPLVGSATFARWCAPVSKYLGGTHVMVRRSCYYCCYCCSIKPLSPQALLPA